MQNKETESQKPFEEWCIVEVMGRRKLAGRCTEQVIAGSTFLRVDIPDTKGGIKHTVFYQPGSLYAITPVAESIARAVAESFTVPPVHRYEVKNLLDQKSAVVDAQDGDDPDELPFG